MAGIIEIKNATVLNKGTIALDDISLKIEEGEFVAVVGPNAAGKTTLLRAINGLNKVKYGSIKVFGKDLKDGNMQNIRREIGYVPQKISIDQKFPISIYEVVLIGRAGKSGIFNRISIQDRKIIEETMDFMGIADISKKPIGHLSGGELQKVLIAKALAQTPKILLLDEPTSHLDFKAKDDLLDSIEKIHKKYLITIILVTHVFEHIPESCSKAVLMKQGKIVSTGKTDELLDEKKLSSIFKE